jgi:glycosyltransferase involved in cell wall biosynthesis
VIIPVHDGAAYLAEAVRSVLAQTVPADEVVVVDDGSADDSARIASAFGQPVRCVRQPHAGAAAARNRGVEEIDGEFVAFLDADDLWLSDKLARQLARLTSKPRVDMVFGLVRQFRSPELPKAADPSPAPQPGITFGAMLVTRAQLLKVGPFDTSFRVGEFVDWYARAADVGLRSDVIPEVVLLRRIHAGNMGRRERDSRVDYVRVVKAALDRRRSAAHGGGGR